MGPELRHALMCGLVLLALWEDTVHLVLTLIPSNAWYNRGSFHVIYISPPPRAGANVGWWFWITFVSDLDLIENQFKYLTSDILFYLTHGRMKQYLDLTLNLPFKSHLDQSNPIRNSFTPLIITTNFWQIKPRNDAFPTLRVFRLYSPNSSDNLSQAWLLKNTRPRYQPTFSQHLCAQLVLLTLLLHFV